MFVNVIYFPPVKAGKDAEFQEWFDLSNAQYARHAGFIRRRLLKPRKGGDYVAIVVHGIYETLMAMHTSPTQAEARRWAKPLLDGDPTPHFYAVAVG